VIVNSCNSDDTIDQIAADVASYDQNHLRRDFNLELGTSPSGYRTMLRRDRSTL